MLRNLRLIPLLAGVLLAAGFFARPVFSFQGAVPSPQGQTHTYYIAADEVAWDYAPSGRNLITGKPFGPEANVFVQRGRSASATSTARPSTARTPMRPSRI